MITQYTFSPQPVQVGVSRYCDSHTHNATPCRSQRGLSWGRQVEETTLNGSTRTSRTHPEEKKFWVRNLKISPLNLVYLQYSYISGVKSLFFFNHNLFRES